MGLLNLLVPWSPEFLGVKDSNDKQTNPDYTKIRLCGIRVEKSTEKARLVFIPQANRNIWLPTSQIQFLGRDDEIIKIPKWLADTHGLVDEPRAGKR